MSGDDGWDHMMDRDDRWGGMMGGDGGWGAIGWLGVSLGTLMVLGIIALLVVLAVREFGHDRQPAAGAAPPAGPGAPTARQILDERFARGDLTEEEYRRRREVLQER